MNEGAELGGTQYFVIFFFLVTFSQPKCTNILGSLDS